MSQSGCALVRRFQLWGSSYLDVALTTVRHLYNVCQCSAGLHGAALLLQLPGIWLVKQLAAIAAVTYKSHTHRRRGVVVSGVRQ